MPKIFMSYRRSDSQDVAGRIYDRLIARFGARLVFKDVDSIPLGVSFPFHLQEVLSTASAVLVIIGPNWINAADSEGRRRLDDPNDYVRVEIEIALRANIPVIPVLVSNAQIPPASDLPLSMRGLVLRNGAPVRPDPDFNNDMERLFSGLRHLEELLGARTVESAVPTMAAIPVVMPIPVATAAPELVYVELLPDDELPSKPKSRPGARKPPKLDDRFDDDGADDNAVDGADYWNGKPRKRKPHFGIPIAVMGGLCVLLACVPILAWILAAIVIVAAIYHFVMIERGELDESGRPWVIAGGALAVIGTILGFVMMAINITLLNMD